MTPSAYFSIERPPRERAFAFGAQQLTPAADGCWGWRRENASSLFVVVQYKPEPLPLAVGTLSASVAVADHHMQIECFSFPLQGSSKLISACWVNIGVIRANNQ